MKPIFPPKRPNMVLAAVVAVVLFVLGVGGVAVVATALRQRQEVVRAERFDMPPDQVTQFFTGAASQFGWKLSNGDAGAYVTGSGPLRARIAPDSGGTRVTITGPRRPTDDMMGLLKRQLPTLPETSPATP